MSSTTATKGNGETVQSEIADVNARFRRPAELALAMNIAKSRENFRWGAGYSTVLTLGTMGYWAAKLKFPFAMLLPMSIAYTYTLHEYDLGYGTKLNRLGMEAHNIIKNERYKYFGKF